VRSEPSAPPAQEYHQRRALRLARAAVLGRRDRLVGYARLGAFLAAVLLAIVSLRTVAFHIIWALLPAGLFLVLLFVHESVRRAWYRARRAVLFYQAGLDRLHDDWKGKGQTGSRFQDEHHPCAADLDLFGHGSLFELLCTARTRTGEDTLAAWLKAGAAPDEVRARQPAVAELRDQLDLREDLALLGSDVPAGVDFDAVVAWGTAPTVLPARWLRWPILVLGLLSVACVLGWLLAIFGVLAPDSWPIGTFFDRAGSLPVIVLIIVELAVAGALMKRVNSVLNVVQKRARDLYMLAGVLARLERAAFTSPRLGGLHAELTGDRAGGPPSQRIARLSGLIDILESRRNQFFAPIAYLVLWGTQCAYALEGWRAASGASIGRWLAILGQFEALSALAGYAYENPDDPFPEIVDAGPCYQGEGLAHPLLPHGKCVPNDLSLGGELRVLIVSGSNMSGKSTFLRTVGINAVLALAGAPVRARRLRLSPLSVGATLRIQDSLQAGHSRFYAEVLRVRQVVDLSRGPVPLLFLLDEIFAGTNSHDRRLGAEAVVMGLVAAGAVGLVTTHDLTLTRIADEVSGRGTNVHFADTFENEVMTFDYRLRSGVVQNSNALALMRAVGLKV
jgi:hypothetical protein